MNIILIGASGSGKTWLSCAFGTNACLSKMKVRYIRMPELFSEFEAKRIQGNYRQYLNQLFKYDLLIIDEFHCHVLMKQKKRFIGTNGKAHKQEIHNILFTMVS